MSSAPTGLLQLLDRSIHTYHLSHGQPPNTLLVNKKGLRKLMPHLYPLQGQPKAGNLLFADLLKSARSGKFRFKGLEVLIVTKPDTYIGVTRLDICQIVTP